MADQAVLTLKVVLEGDVRRLRGWPEQGAERDMESLRRSVGSLFGMAPEAVESLRLAYRDGEGDSCALVDATLPDALHLAEADHVLRVCAAPAAVERAPARFAQALSGADERLESARPHLAEGLAHFGREVAGDFRNAWADMEDAFTPRVGGADAERSPALRFAGAAAGVTTGALVAARLAPVRAVRLAAQSVAAVAGATPMEDVAGAAVAKAASPAEEAPAGTVAEGLSSELRHFKDLVVQDYHFASGEVRATFGYVASSIAHRPRVSAAVSNAQQELAADGTSTAQLRPQQEQQAHPEQKQPGQEQPEQQPQQPQRQWSAKDVAPAAAAVAGAAVASTLVPVRVLRLAVGSFKAVAGAASTARVGASEAGAGAGGSPEGTSHQVVEV